MGRIISIANQKGGVGKTTTAVNVSAILAKRGKKVMLIDADPQGNASSGLGLEKETENSLYDVLINDVDLESTLQDTNIKTLKVCPSNMNLAGAEVELVSQMSREQRLKEKLDVIKDNFDFIIIDCPPSLGLIIDNALFASDSVIIPVECGFYAYDALTQMVNKIDEVQKIKKINIEGILLTKLDNRNTFGYKIVDKVRFMFPNKTFKTIISASSHIQEAPMYGKTVIQFSYNSRGSKEYRELAKEILGKE